MKKIILQSRYAFLMLSLAFIANVGQAQEVELNFTDMTPHIGQKLELRLIDKSTNKEVDRTSLEAIETAEFSVTMMGEMGGSYYIDFYADLNANGVYDAPPTDHAWRVDADGIVSGTNSFDFAHNTDFLDIEWKQMLTFEFTDMTPHIGQLLEIRVKDINQTGREVGRFTLDEITESDFTIDLPFLQVGRTYVIDFYADLNQNGYYDEAPTDHSWRETLSEIEGDVTLEFVHNTDFVSISQTSILTVDFSGMTPHVGQMLELRVIEDASGKEIGRTKQMIMVDEFEVEISGIEQNMDYTIDFYADLNQNGTYEVAPTDHAWRESFTSGDSNEVVEFAHNTDFVDINWVYMLTFSNTDMTPHLGQRYELKVIDTETDLEVGSFEMPAIMVEFFFVRVPGIVLGENYNIDFFADLSANGTYDAPPTDHAWRVNFDDDNGDELVIFEHNTDFVDIEFITAIETINDLESMSIYPNPFNESFQISMDLNSGTDMSIRLFNGMGQEVRTLFQGKVSPGKSTLHFNQFNDLESGIYFVKIEYNNELISTTILKK